MLKREAPEQVVLLEDFPQADPGAPRPVLLASGHALVLLFYLRMDDPEAPDEAADNAEAIAAVTFDRASIHTFGSPGDETLSGHRLYPKGLHFYAAQEVLNSAWLDQLEGSNAVHPRHDRARFLAGERHFIVTFHDNTFECIARGYSFERHSDPMPALVARYAALLEP